MNSYAYAYWKMRHLPCPTCLTAFLCGGVMSTIMYLDGGPAQLRGLTGKEMQIFSDVFPVAWDLKPVEPLVGLKS